ncbi:arginase [Neptunitalea chrysea]|uniref:Arginase n=1 Tax=Neptunitalea chrysea TaxID=1647581 RepID=A0A9W6ETT0_9FLAO|nr:formimidoylglutamase [Neptunitalea chrysea]GLB51574.1 arginase [Neptunitalea chrysea]
MGFEFLSPVKESLVQYVETLNVFTLGAKLTIYTEESEFPDLNGVSIALLGVPECRGDRRNSNTLLNLSEFRKQLYQLFPGNWAVSIADLGDINPGAEVNDTYYALKEIVAELIKKQITPIIIGGSQDLTYAAYRAYDKLDQMVNLVSVDNSFDLKFDDEGLHAESFLNSVIQEMPPNLSDYANIGYQVYYNSQEGLDLMEKLFFESFRLGEVVNDLGAMEPVFRNADLVSFDMSAVQGSDLGHTEGSFPNGFNAREICGLARYAGISDRVSCFGLFNVPLSERAFQLSAQLVWYFIEGYNYRYNEYPFGSKENFFKYIVPVDDTEIIFYKSDKSGRWWMEVSIFEKEYNNFVKETLIPCTEQDYLNATRQITPERWWRIYQKSVN